MMRARTKSLIALCLVAAVGLAGVVACGADSASAFDGPPSALQDGGGSFGDGSFTSPDAGEPVGAASGVVILHAAAFPAFRLCFENFPNLAPQPDNTVMPQANVVGVEVGSIVRIAPLDKPPGKVYVFDRRTFKQDSPTRSCKSLLSSGDVTKDVQYHEAGSINEPLGVNHVDVLAVTGCGDGARLTELGFSTSDCDDWNTTKAVQGDLHVRQLPLFPSIAASATSVPVQLIHMSELLEKQRGANIIDVTFGAFDAGAVDGGGGGLGQVVATNPNLFDASAPPVKLMVDQSEENVGVYGDHGFRITLRPADGGAPSFEVDQSLAEVQELSAPATLPTTYYLAASNYVLLLLGDPRLRRFPDGGASPSYDPRLAVHLLAVPVKEATPDAGTTIVDDASTPPADQ